MNNHRHIAVPDEPGKDLPYPQIEQFKNALEEARAHLECIPRHNALALRVQERIIKQHEDRIAELTKKDWIHE